MRQLFNLSVATAAILFVAPSAFAQKAGDNIVSAGLTSIHPDTVVGQLTNSGVAQAAVDGATAKVSRETALSLSWLHMYTDNLGAEVTLGIPPTMTQDLTTPATGAHPSAAKIKFRAPAVVGHYFFGTSQDQWRPFLGLGVARVSFPSVRTNTSDPTIGYLGGNGASFSSSWAPIYHAGIFYNIDEKWGVSGSVAYLPVKTNASFVGRGVYGTTTGEIKLNTTSYVVRVGYRF